MVGLSLCFLFSLLGCGRDASQKTVVVYVSEDQVFSEPVLKDFETKTGIRVRAVYDTEEANGTGVMNRIIAEKANPQADVYWANEPVRAEILKQMGIAAPYMSPSAKDIQESFKDPEGYWTGFSARARVFLVNKRVKNKPRSIMAYTDPVWNRKGVIANPLFGTTTVQIAALFALWGDARAADFMKGLKENEIRISTSNGESADPVALGEFDFALVDSDDAVSRLRRGKPVEIVLPDQGQAEPGALILPNAVVLIHGAKNRENAEKLMDYLLSRETERKLAYEDCAQIPLHPGVETPADVPKIEDIKVMSVDYTSVAQKARRIQPILKGWTGY
jgi:iron(III) transport system substrate-binding protein